MILHSIQFIKNDVLCILYKLKIINQTLTTVIPPESLKIAKITHLYKKADASNFNKYRPISLLPVISKIFEKIHHSQILKYFTSNTLLSKINLVFDQNIRQNMQL